MSTRILIIFPGPRRDSQFPFSMFILIPTILKNNKLSTPQLHRHVEEHCTAVFVPCRTAPLYLFIVVRLETCSVELVLISNQQATAPSETRVHVTSVPSAPSAVIYRSPFNLRVALRRSHSRSLISVLCC